MMNSSQSALVLVVLAMLILFGAMAPDMLSAANARNILIQTSYLMVFATAQMFVIVVRGFDLSVGTLASTVSVASAMIMVACLSRGFDPAAAILIGALAGLGCGVLIGLINGVTVSYLNVNPFVTTFGMLNICLGIASTMSGGSQIFDLPPQLNATFYGGTLLWTPAPILFAIACALLSFVTLRYTRFGRALFLIGSNPRAALVAGINTHLHLAGAYLVCALLASAGALMLTARTGSGEPNIGGSIMLESIAAAVIGGVSLKGGEANVLAPILGALIITILSTGMNMIRVDGYVQQIVLGLVILVTVFLEQSRRASR